MTYTLL